MPRHPNPSVELEQPLCGRQRNFFWRLPNLTDSGAPSTESMIRRSFGAESCASKRSFCTPDFRGYWGSKRRSELPLVANKRSSSHAAGTSAYPPTGDIRWPMSVIVPISSANPPGADIRDRTSAFLAVSPALPRTAEGIAVRLERGFMTRLGHSEFD